MHRYGRQRTQEVQDASSYMMNTELNEQDGYIPDFVEANEDEYAGTESRYDGWFYLQVQCGPCSKAHS